MSLLGSLFKLEGRTIGNPTWDEPWNGWGSYPNRSGVSVNEDTAFNLSAVWACETLIADSVAMLPVDTYRKSAEVRTPTTSPGWVERPNPLQTQIEFETQRVLSLLGWGNAYVLLIRQSGPGSPVLERWVLSPWRVSVNWNYNSNANTYLVDGKEVPVWAIQHIKGYTSPGRHLGMSVISHGTQSFGLAMAAEQFDAAFFSNGASPAGVLESPTMPAEMTKDVIDRLRDQFIASNGGNANARKPLVLVGGTKWTQTMVNPEDAQLLETRKFQVEEIARWFRVPPYMIGDVNRSTSWGTGIEQQGLGFVRHTLMPWLVRLEQADSQLIPRGQYVHYNVNALVRADLKTRYEAYTMGRNGGWLSADDIRSSEDLLPLPDGKGGTYLQPLNMAEAGATPPEPPPDPTPPPDGSP